MVAYKKGVSSYGLKEPMVQALPVVDGVYADYGFEAVVTSTTEGVHMMDSLHYEGLAVDVRIPSLFAAEIAGALRRRLGSDFDVVLESDHIHIEYDPKGG